MRKPIMLVAVAILVAGLSGRASAVQIGSVSHLTVVHSSDNTGEGTVTVNRAKLYRVPLDPNGGDDCSSAVCGASFPVGTRVTLTATPAPGSTFVGWGGDCTGTAPTCVIWLPGHRDVMVYFSK